MSDMKQIVETARQLKPSERGAYIDQACGSDQALREAVERSLAGVHDAATLTAPIDPDATLTRMDQRPALPREQQGEMIGNYKLLQQIGEGGFGSVWMAEQREPVKRRVALKIIKLGMDTRQVIARFEAERQALAMMDHPNIAKVFDAGSTETGRPYFVMELVKGVPIIEYCDKERLDAEERLKLFMLVCHAIQHAHQKGIVHRDIKPSNVLVTLHDGKPVPKVIDFGIAKATNQELTEKTLFTQHNQMIGTPAYMSPEQAEMSGLDIDTRSDIYSLGVLLYELLTGTTPFSGEDLMSKGFAEMMRIIKEETPHKPSTRLHTLGDTGTRTAAQRSTADIRRLGLIIRGDLDWIVMKCLEKDRTRRYETANGLALDIERHLHNQPVIAGPPSASYRFRKFVRRNRVGVLAASGIGIAILLGLAGTSGGLYWALQEKNRADLAAEQAREAQAEAQARSEDLQQVVEFQSAQLSGIDVPQMGVTMRQDLLDNTRLAGERQQLNQEEIDQRVGALDQDLAGVDFTGIAQSTLETNIFAPAIETIQTQFEEQPEIRVELLTQLGQTLKGLGLFEMARQPILDSIEIRTSLLGATEFYTLDARMRYAMLLNDLGEFEESDQLFKELIETATDSHGEDSRMVINLYNNYATLLYAQNRVEEAGAYYEKALPWLRANAGNLDPDTLGTINSLASVYSNTERYAEAEELFQEAVDGFTKVHGLDDPRTIQTLNNYAGLYRTTKELDKAEEIFVQALTASRVSLGEDHWQTLMLKDNLGGVKYTRGELDEASRLAREAMEGRRRTLGEHHAATLRSCYNLAMVYSNMRRFEESEELLINTLPGFEQVYGQFHSYTITLRTTLIGIMFQLKHFTDIEKLLLDEYALIERTPDAPQDRKRSVVRALGIMYGLWDEAEPESGHAEQSARWKSELESMPKPPEDAADT